MSMPTVVNTRLSCAQIDRAMAARSAGVSLCSWEKSVSCIGKENLPRNRPLALGRTTRAYTHKVAPANVRLQGRSGHRRYLLQFLLMTRRGYRLDRVVSNAILARIHRLIRVQQAGDGLDLVAGIFRQAGADRFAGIERRLSHQDLRRHEVAQNRYFFEFALLIKHAGLDRQRHECGHDCFVDVRRVGLKNSEKLAEFHDLIDVENVLREHAGDRRVKLRLIYHIDLGGPGARQWGALALTIDAI